MSFAEPADNKAFTDQVSVIFKECSKIKAEMTTRAEPLKYFTTEGGLSAPNFRTYVSKCCKYVKIDLKFPLSKPNQQMVELSTDVIQSISKPYLEYSILD